MAAVDGVEKRDVLSLMATVLRWGGVMVVALLGLTLVVDAMTGEVVPAVSVGLGEIIVSSVNLALLPEGVEDLVRDDLVLPRDEKRVVEDVRAEDHMSVRVRGLFNFCWDLEEVGGGRSLSSTSISSAIFRRDVR